MGGELPAHSGVGVAVPAETDWAIYPTIAKTPGAIPPECKRDVKGDRIFLQPQILAFELRANDCARILAGRNASQCRIHIPLRADNFLAMATFFKPDRLSS